MAETASVQRRDPAKVMRLKRLGSLHQCRLSFMRILMRRLVRDQWQFDRPVFAIDENSTGYAVYTAHGPDNVYSLVAFAHDLDDSKRSDRVIAEAWDSTFALFDGIPTEEDISRLAANVPLQEAGRVSEKELTLSRANRSVRLWAHVVESLADGRQPDIEQLTAVGYLMRTTAVYGSGKFGAIDREMLAGREEMQPPFQAEMLTVFLIRTFVRDLVQHAANERGGERAARLDPSIARQLGIGNSTGLGMAPFIVNHPVLFSNWLMVKEEAIARVRSLQSATDNEKQLFLELLGRSDLLISQWHSQHPVQQQKLADLERDMRLLKSHVSNEILSGNQPWNRLIEWSEQALSVEGQELLASLVIEPYSELVDGLESCMSDSTSAGFQIDGSMAVKCIRHSIERDFGWALALDWDSPEHCARAWYVSEEKLEPRLGERFEEEIAEYEQALAPARDAVRAYKALETCPEDQPVAGFLLKYPQHRQSIRRAQLSEFAPYSEIRDNTISAELMPVDMLRAKLSFFGATFFDPRSDRWVRICMFAGAPYPEELSHQYDDHWVFPELPSTTANIEENR
ncbi:hypothetical protein AB833_12890 [Chromatiales bacterium (ex Bugula neritina AB1)]|nr:hypothetical protein AB833_12890 [Chromatiales bacterium (ex Bugula neritina AB1)]